MGGVGLDRVAAAVDLVLPRSCGACGVPSDESVCDRCLSRLVAGLFIGGPAWVRPDPAPAAMMPVVVAGPYAGVLGRLLRAYKDGERRDLRLLLAALLSRVLTSVVMTAPLAGAAPVVVPMPSSARAVRMRGDDPVADLVRVAAVDAGLPVSPVLRLTGRPADQAGLTAGGRAANVRGAMQVAPERRWDARRGPWRALLCDDVVTTGSTLVEGARAIRASGGEVVCAAALAATPRAPPTRPETDEIPLPGKRPGEKV